MTTISKKENFVEHAKALFIFAHGAGADKSSEFMEKFTLMLNEQNINVLRFNFNYMDKRLLDGKRYPPEKMDKLIACFGQVLANISSKLPVYLIGKSMGGRVAATLAEQALDNIQGVVCLGYPFHPQKKPEKLRLTPLQNTQLPILILQGERDALGCKEEIANYQLSSKCRLVYLPDGDHDLKPRVKSGFTHQQHLTTAITEIVKFIDEPNE